MSIIANTSSLPNNKIIIIKSEMVLQDFHLLAAVAARREKRNGEGMLDGKTTASKL